MLVTDVPIFGDASLVRESMEPSFFTGEPRPDNEPPNKRTEVKSGGKGVREGCKGV